MANDTATIELNVNELLDEMNQMDIIAYLEEDVMLEEIDDDTIKAYAINHLNLVEEE